MHYLQCLFLKESQSIGKDVQSFDTLPISCMEVSVDGQVLIAERRHHSQYITVSIYFYSLCGLSTHVYYHTTPYNLLCRVNVSQYGNGLATIHS